MWLLDANMDIHLAALLTERGITCDTAANRGWKALSNGQLVAAAMASGFDCLLTRDRLFSESASRALRSQPAFAVVLITCRNNAGRSTGSALPNFGPHRRSNRSPDA